MLGQYVGVVEMECQCLIDMINQHVLPDCKTAGLSTAGIEGALASLEAGLHGVHAACVHAAPCPSAFIAGRTFTQAWVFLSASLYAALRASLNLPCVPLLLAGAVTMYCAPQRVRELLCTPSACVWLCRLVLASRVVVAHSEDEEEKQAALCRVLRLETMVAAREAVEEQEAVRRPHLCPGLLLRGIDRPGLRSCARRRSGPWLPTKTCSSSTPSPATPLWERSLSNDSRVVAHVYSTNQISRISFLTLGKAWTRP